MKPQRKNKASSAGYGRLDNPRQESRGKQPNQGEGNILPFKQKQGSGAGEFVVPMNPCACCKKVTLPYGFVVDRLTKVVSQVCSRRCNEDFYTDLFARLACKLDVTKPTTRTTRERLTSTT